MKFVTNASADSVNLLRVADTAIPQAGKMYLGWTKLNSTINNLMATDEAETFFEDSYEQVAFQGVVMERWNHAHNPLLSAAWFLDPEYNSSYKQQDNPEAMKDFIQVCEKIHHCDEKKAG